MNTDIRLAICGRCDERPTGCWKAIEYDCTTKYHAAGKRAAEMADCPIEKLGSRSGISYHLPNIKTLVYTVDKPHCIRRHKRVQKMLDGYGFLDWSFHYGPIGDPYWQAIRPDYAALLRDHEPPLLILEDDVAVRDYRADITVPSDADVVYLGGGGAWSSGKLTHMAIKALPDLPIYRSRQIGMMDVDEVWVRVFGMFSTHAILHVRKSIMLEMADLIDAADYPVDVTFGMNQWKWNCLLRRIPIWWQDDGHNGWGTFEYGPLPPESVGQWRNRANRMRERRQAILRRVVK